MELKNQDAMIGAVHQIIKVKRDNKPVTFNTFCSQNLFSNLTIEENLLHQSFISSVSEVISIIPTTHERELLQVTLVNFCSFFPKAVPLDLLKAISFYSFILKDTDYGLFIPPLVISEDENRINQCLINFMQKNRDKIFINVQNTHIKDQNSFLPKKTTEQKKAA